MYPSAKDTLADRRVIPIAISVMALLVISCASGPQTGVRTDFEQIRVTTVAVAPFYSSGSFGLDSQQRQQIEAYYEDAASSALALHGFDVIDSQAMRHHLTELDLWRDFEDGIDLRQNLRNYFEPVAAGADQPIEVQTMRDLGAHGALPAETILFGEIIYQSYGTCRQAADAHAAHAEVSITPSAPSELPRPCVSSHFQAKLVDVRTGRTMWFNRIFLETHTHQLAADTERLNIARAVELIFDAGTGIADLAPLQRPDDTHADTTTP